MNFRETKRMCNILGVVNESYMKAIYHVDTTNHIIYLDKKDIEGINIFSVLSSVIRQKKYLTRDKGYDKMCLEEDLLEGCNNCPYKDYCCSNFGKTVR